MQNIVELLTRVLCDTKPSTPADGAFLFGQTINNQESVFVAAQRLLDATLVPRILFVKTVAMSGYPGFDAWKRALHLQGIGDMQIEGVTGINSSMLHTRIEAEALIRFAKSKGYRSLFIVAAPFQQLRAFMTAVTIALQEYPELKLYSQPGMALPWLEEVAHSQGSVVGARSKLIAGELERIEKYGQKGDLGTVEDVLTYLDRRDA